METEFRLSTRLVIWGDALDPNDICDRTATESSQCNIAMKGERVVRPDGSDTGSRAKTSRWMYSCDSQHPEWSHQPARQLGRFEDMLRRIGVSLLSLSGVDAAELQLSIYYGEAKRGEPDFEISPSLLSVLAFHRIGLRITALP